MALGMSWYFSNRNHYCGCRVRFAADDVMREKVQLIEAQPTAEQAKGVRKNVFLAQCYRMAAQYVFEHPGARLIHGTIRHRQGPLADKVIQHAWVDLQDGKVFDGVLQKFFEKTSYYRFWRAKSNGRLVKSTQRDCS
jgi:hypothetical protein